MKGHDKGSSFEREISRKLSLWWSESTDDAIFWRNRVRVTSKTPNAEMQMGDIVAIKPSGLIFTSVFSIECKSGYSKNRTKRICWDLLDLLDSKGKSVLTGFWDQAIKEAQIDNRIPMLIFKRDHHIIPIISLTDTGFSLLKNYFGKFDEIKSMIYINPIGDGCSDLFYFFNLNEFLDIIDPRTMEAFCNGYYKKYIRK